MKPFTETVNCEYPIVAMAMNKVSDLTLALAIRRAGGMPSLSIFNYYIAPEVIDRAKLEHDLIAYRQVFGDCDILVSTSVSALLNLRLTEMLSRLSVAVVELILDDDITSRADNSILQEEIARLKNNGVQVFVKVITEEDIIDGIDGIVLKGPAGAGRGNTQGISLEELFDTIHAKYPDLLIIPAGGISNGKHICDYMTRGAWACGVGTLFAAAEESRVSLETKLKMVESTAQDLQQLSNGNIDTFAQNALVFSHVEGDNFNNTRGLMAGVRSPQSGHIFAGIGIDAVTAILPVKQVIDNLTKDL